MVIFGNTVYLWFMNAAENIENWVVMKKYKIFWEYVVNILLDKVLQEAFEMVDDFVNILKFLEIF